MTLDIKKYFKNLIEKEAKISHFQVKVDAGKTLKMRKSYETAIEKEYGEGFLQDADYILFFERDESWDADGIKKLFELTNRALGKDANMLSKNDFQMLPSVGEVGTDSDDEIPDEDIESTEQSEDDTTESNIVFLKITIK